LPPVMIRLAQGWRTLRAFIDLSHTGLIVRSPDGPSNEKS
jgi:hypothetical protein